MKTQMQPSVQTVLKRLHIPKQDSHKGQNGRLLIIGGSHLFHSASLWALKIASRIVDLVHYASVPENNQLVQKLYEEFRDGIVVPRSHIEDYILEDDCVLIGPGMVRTEKITNTQYSISNIKEIETLEDEGEQTYCLTKYLLGKYPNKRWVIDAGALQMLEPSFIPEGAILTPHGRELELLISNIQYPISNNTNEKAQQFAKKHQCVVLLKGEEDVVTDGERMEVITGGNAGMTKGGTGDVLAGLVAALACKNDPFDAAVAASYINKQAGNELFQTKGYWFNASDLADQIPKTMKKLLLS